MCAFTHAIKKLQTPSAMAVVTKETTDKLKSTAAALECQPAKAASKPPLSRQSAHTAASGRFLEK
eukprot:1809100-Prymnesium_polylepis.3